MKIQRRLKTMLNEEKQNEVTKMKRMTKYMNEMYDIYTDFVPRNNGIRIETQMSFDI